MLTRNAGDSLRLFLAALVLQLVLGLDLAVSVIAISGVTILYTFIGGAKSVIWNDCIQFTVYMAGAAAAALVVVGVGRRAALTGFLVGVTVLSCAALWTPVHWAWYALVGSLGTFTSGWLVQAARDRAAVAGERT